MKDMVKIALNLVIIFVIAGAIMATVYGKTEPRIKQIIKEQTQKALKSLIPEAAFINSAGTYQPLPGRSAKYYEARDKNGKPLGYIAVSYSKGYKSILKMMVAADTTMRLKGIKILEENETPGLGDDIKKPWFQKQFEGKTMDQLVVVKVPDPTKILAITGATISSRDCTRGVKTGLKQLMKTYLPGPNNQAQKQKPAGGQK